MRVVVVAFEGAGEGDQLGDVLGREAEALGCRGMRDCLQIHLDTFPTHKVYTHTHYTQGKESETSPLLRLRDRHALVSQSNMRVSLRHH